MIERQTEHSEEMERINSPHYRVNFWSRQSEEFGWNLDAYLLDDALSINEVLTWAVLRADGRSYEVFAVITVGSTDETMLVRLVGTNPNRSV
ncbi:hypothetical protein [Rathayibacter iranicus]|uniref:Uncharacterized protein n=1 Tax=Rathayibacter iranicus TaxID=59737 RepID=A0AAD1ENB6_9MICO|nr:hypothetical protein [Rathayibacter iranicus]AZZ56983.1 hypothetical protein C7V51_14685 [Rathayibacter iranicus]MWV29591.1 hypothetical protein [Rathayibacter iranicus NCPPB 2253 = VKM Ac-1602]PPI41907.1 hypothetical protein C5E09_13540 [Rathayibacter iranicus]PPI57647.1 hypothetical protein C5E08_14440 [Rathayibacter iranicus]PPI68627.1 hypothetical protein C5E01_13495 [Rathayibacter iranicus]